MSLLGTMMVRAGLLSDEQLAAVQATSSERKLSFVEALLAHGFADEDSVVGFLHSKLMIPKVGASVLDSVDRNALDRIPGELAARHAVLPISSDETGNLTLAMVDPTDMKAVDAISAHTGAYLVRAVAPLRVIRSAISRHYGIEPPALPSLQPARASAPTPAAVVAPAAPTPVPSASSPRPAAVVAPAAVLAAPVVSPPVVAAPGVGAPAVVAPPVVPPAVAPVAAPAVAPPVASAPAVAAPPVPSVPEVPAPAPVVTPPVGRPSAPSGAAIRPAAVLQPSAVFMPGAPRPAAVLPATALAPTPYGITPQPVTPVAAPPPAVPPLPDAAVPVVRPPSAPVVAAPVSSASTRPLSAPVPSASSKPVSAPVLAASSKPAAAPASAASSAPGVTQPFVSGGRAPASGGITQPLLAGALAATPAAGVAPAPGNVTQPLVSGTLAQQAAPAAAFTPVSTATQPLISGGLGATASAAPAVAAQPVPAASFTPASTDAQPFAAGGLLAAAAASAAASAGLAPSQPVPADSSDESAELSELHRGQAPTVPVYSGAMATLRQHDPADSSSRGATLPGNELAGDTLTGGSRPPDVVDIPLDDLDETDRGTTLIPGEPIPGEQTFDSAKTATWIPPTFGAANEIVPLSPEAFHRLLPRFATVKTRDEVTDLLLDFLAEGFSRVIMFVHVKGEIRGRDARGEDLLVEAVRQIRIPAGGPSMFSNVIERHAPYFGPMRTDTPIDAAFFSALGGVEGVVLVLPVLLRDKVPLIVFASGSSNPVDPRSLHDLTHEVAAALERIIVLEKTRK